MSQMQRKRPPNTSNSAYLPDNIHWLRWKQLESHPEAPEKINMYEKMSGRLYAGGVRKVNWWQTDDKYHKLLELNLPESEIVNIHCLFCGARGVWVPKGAAIGVHLACWWRVRWDQSDWHKECRPRFWGIPRHWSSITDSNLQRTLSYMFFAKYWQNEYRMSTGDLQHQKKRREAVGVDLSWWKWDDSQLRLSFQLDRPEIDIDLNGGPEYLDSDEEREMTKMIEYCDKLANGTYV